MPGDDGVQAEHRTDAANMPDHISHALKQEAEETGERAVRTEQYQFNHDLDTRRTDSSRSALLSERARLEKDRRMAANTLRSQEEQRRLQKQQKGGGQPLKSSRRRREDIGPVRLPEVYITHG